MAIKSFFVLILSLFMSIFVTSVSMAHRGDKSNHTPRYNSAERAARHAEHASRHNSAEHASHKADYAARHNSADHSKHRRSR